jgi:hypothetical protein
MPDLLPARDPGRGDDRLLRLRSDGREEPQLADLHRQFVVLRLVTERTGHATAPGVQLDDLSAGDAAQQRDCRGGSSERLLVAVTVEQNAPATELVPSRNAEPTVRKASTSSSSGSLVAAATCRAAASPGSRARYSSRSVSRQDGSTPTIATPRARPGARLSRLPADALGSPGPSTGKRGRSSRPRTG